MHSSGHLHSSTTFSTFLLAPSKGLSSHNPKFDRTCIAPSTPIVNKFSCLTSLLSLPALLTLVLSCQRSSRSRVCVGEILLTNVALIPLPMCFSDTAMRLILFQLPLPSSCLHERPISSDEGFFLCAGQVHGWRLALVTQLSCLLCLVLISLGVH